MGEYAVEEYSQQTKNKYSITLAFVIPAGAQILVHCIEDKPNKVGKQEYDDH